ncbi:hypothetical protein ABZX85_48745 [Streptomyces sp. NPDC004539]|uniref:tetratricopeptide repeat protein n=1 Tax=Streptomyces sp. NPDC004539 TaxID=3154280 RepID=UPI0033B84CDF
MDGERLYEELAGRRLVAVSGGSDWGRTLLVQQLAHLVPRESLILVEDIGVEEPQEVTLLRLLASPPLRRRFDVSELEPTPEFPESLRALCRRVLSGLPVGTVLLLDGAGRPLLDTVRGLINGTPVAVAALGVSELLTGYHQLPADEDGPPTPGEQPARLSPGASRLYEHLAALTTTGTLFLPYPPLLASSIPVLPGAIAQLSGRYLARETNSGVRLYGSAVADVTGRWSAEQLHDRAVSVFTRLLKAADGPLVDAHAWTYVLLAGRLLSLSRDDDVRGLVRTLTTELERADHVLELMALWVYTGSPPVATARRDGQVGAAVKKWERGNLREAARLLAAIPDRRPANGWVLHTRAAVACDRGDLRGVGPLLRRAIEAHQVAGDLRGEAWAMLYYGRWRLLSGDFDEGEKLIDAARVAFQDVHDAEGIDWAGAEQMRLAMLLGVSGFTDDVPVDDAFPTRIQPNRRHEMWANLFFALSKAGDWRHRAPLVLRDQLCAAWSRHFTIIRAWLSLPSSPGRVGDEIIELSLNIKAFANLGCPHGSAWTSLELAIRNPHHPSGPHSFAHARARFTEIGDEAGLAWTTLAQALANNEDPPPEALRELARRYPPTLLATTEWPWDHGRFRIPFAARLLIPEPRYEHAEFRLPATESKVRLTLHDDHRLTLQVVPGPRHPWSTSPTLPWLSARATPLTPADIDPDHAVTIRPGPPDDTDAGAEFRFTPHRPGPHRIRFTVEHHLTGTVLQEVETEFDVTDTTTTPSTGTTPTSLRRP